MAGYTLQLPPITRDPLHNTRRTTFKLSGVKAEYLINFYYITILFLVFKLFVELGYFTCENVIFIRNLYCHV